MSDVEPDWSLDSCSYKELQRFAKHFNIRANQKAVKLRKDLLEHKDAIREMQGLALKRQRPSTARGAGDGDRSASGAAEASGDRSASGAAEGIGDRWMGNITLRNVSGDGGIDSVEVFSRETLLSISVEELLSGDGFLSLDGKVSTDGISSTPSAGKALNRTFDRSSLSPVGGLSKTQPSPRNTTFTKSREESPLDATFTTAPTATNFTCGKKRKLNETFSDSDEQHNETYSVESDDDMKENVAPADGDMPSLVHPLGDALIRVEEDDQSFIIFDQTECPSLMEKTFTKSVSVELPKKRGEVSRAPATSALRKISRPSAGSGYISKPKNVKTKVRMPDFTKIHQKAFDKMESVRDFNNRRKGVLKTSTSHENRSISSLPTICKVPSKNVDNLRMVAPRIPHQHGAKRQDHSRINCFSIPSRNKFDLKESLKKKPTWDIRKGPLSIGSTAVTSRPK